MNCLVALFSLKNKNKIIKKMPSAAFDIGAATVKRVWENEYISYSDNYRFVINVKFTESVYP